MTNMAFMMGATVCVYSLTVLAKHGYAEYGVTMAPKSHVY